MRSVSLLASVADANTMKTLNKSGIFKNFNSFMGDVILIINVFSYLTHQIYTCLLK